MTEHFQRQACKRGGPAPNVTDRHLPSATFGGWTYQKNGLQQIGLNSKDFIKQTMASDGVDRETAKRVLSQVLDRQIWLSDDGKYKVVKEVCYHDDPMPMIHHEMWDGTIWLSVRIASKGFYGDTHLRDWRDFQMIKQDLCGPNKMAVEVYPKQKYCVDTAHVFHLWVLPEDIDLPIGWKNRDVTENDDPCQRPLRGWCL